MLRMNGGDIFHDDRRIVLREVKTDKKCYARFSFFFFCCLFLLSCSAVSTRRHLAERLAGEEGTFSDDARIAELKKEIRAVESQVEKIIVSVQKKGMLWRLLGLKYKDYQMWEEALFAFNEALAIYPEKPALLYNRALCTGRLALLSNQTDTRRAYVERSEKDYRSALLVNPSYTPAMYALAVLLVFELERPFEAAPLLDAYLAIERSSVPARFLRARVLLEESRPGEALALYEEIQQITQNEDDRLKARELSARISRGE